MAPALLNSLDSNMREYLTFNTLWVFMMLYGSVAIMYYIIHVIDILMDLFVREPVSLDNYGANEGKWAVVTGCTDGIGKAMALYLANKGFNIILLSRTPEKLQSVEVEISELGMKSKSYAVDFTTCTDDQWKDISAIIKERQVSILINNVGLCHENPIFFDEEDAEHCNNIIKVNITTMMNLTRIVVPQMQAQKNGLIINLGSFAAIRSLGFLSVYAGSKGFIKTYSQSLAYELEPDGIMVTHIYSFWVTSKMSGYREPTLSVPSPEQYTDSLFEHLGLKCGAYDSHTTIPYYPHAILNFIMSILWDPVLAIPPLYSVGNNLYQLGQQRQTRRKDRKDRIKKSVDEEISKLIAQNKIKYVQ